MATKYLHSLADENPDLRKQIGCMTGVFHIFNRNQVVSRNRFVGHGHKRLSHGGMLFNNGTPERESSPNRGNRFMEKHRVSTESFSSWSPSSPFSYVERRPNPEHDDSSSLPHQHLDLRDKVKDSMYREARGLSHKVLEKLQEPNWQCNEPTELSRSKSCQLKDGFSKHYPRFSYDGQSQTTTPKQLKELPRLSLDSRERSIKTLNSVSIIPIKPSDSKLNLNSRNPKTHEDKSMIQTRPSVVAKLMGLETFPNSTSISDKDLDLSKSFKGNNHSEVIKRSNSIKEPTSPCWKNPDLKPISRVSNEAAPWKNRDGGPVQTPKNTSPHVTKSFSVYSEVDKRLKNLEFEQSGKDLRALKHILEAMQAVEARKGEKDIMVSSENVSRAEESNIVIMKPTKLVEKGFLNTKMGRDPNIESISSKDSLKSRKKSEARCQNRRRHSSSSTQEKSSLLVKVGEPLTQEYPSPVSVLDDSVYLDNSLSPIKKHTPNSQKDTVKQNLAENFPKFEATNELISSVTSQINREKLQKVERLVRKLKGFNSSHDEAHIDYIASLCENANTNDRYISEIFLASGLLLRDLELFEFHSSGHPINPELFLVLERTRFGNLQKEKFDRKLIFDAVNEILVGKLNSVSLMVKNPRELLSEVCLEIERNQRMQVEKKRERCDEDDDDDLKRILREDLAKRSENWKGFYGETPVVAMEVEWLIFRDLVNELVISETNCCY